MEQTKFSSPRLFVCTAVENKDEIEERYERAYNYLQGLISGLSEQETHDALNNAVCKEKNHDDVYLGLLTSILSDPTSAARSYRDLTLVARDGLASMLNHLSNLILERYLRLHDTARTQLLWLVREMIRNAVTNVDNICWNLMRYASGGDITSKNIFLIESLLDIFIEHRTWLDKFPVLICSVVYTYLRLIEDHNVPQLIALRQKEVTFVILLMRDRFSDVLTLGRDLVRLLQNVARINEFNQLWRDILTDPKSLCPSFTSVLQLLQTRTSRRFLQSRLTPDMERKLVFLTAQVRFGNHKRYQEWFQRQYLATPESQSLRSDMIRFIVGVIHPTNELLCSDIIPRWAVIGWLLTTCTSGVAASNAKLALFYDWLLYDPEKDNIMNVEPAVLVMHHSMRSHPAVTATLLDFLCRIIPNFHPTLVDKVRQGIFNSLRQIVEKRVLPTLYPLFDSPKLDRELRISVRDTFREFCVPDDSASPVRIEDFPGPARGPDEPAFSDDEEDEAVAATSGASIILPIGDEDTDDDDLPLSEVRMRERPAAEELANALPASLRPAAERLLSERTAAGRGAAVEALLDAAVRDIVDTAALADLVAVVLQDEPPPRLSRHPDLAELLEAGTGPIFSMFNCLLAEKNKEDDKKKRLVLESFKEIHLQNSFQSVGYLLLFYLKLVQVIAAGEEKDAAKRRDVKYKRYVYIEYCEYLDVKVIDGLAEDFRVCQECDVNTMVWMIPEVYREFQVHNHIPIVHCIVSAVDAAQLQQLVCLRLQGVLAMFKADDIMTLLNVSLTWETFEQYCLWQLLTAHDISVDDITPILPRLDVRTNAEALTAILLLLKVERPTLELVRLLFCREVPDGGDPFVMATLMYWCQDYEERVGELVALLLSTRYPGTSPNKRKRTATKSLSPNQPPSAEQVLSHLEYLRRRFVAQDDMSFYKLENVQKALQQAQSNSNDTVRRQYSELFSMAWEEELLISRRARKVLNQAAARVNAHNDSNDDSEDEEIVVKPRQAKRRKKAISDSD